MKKLTKMIKDSTLEKQSIKSVKYFSDLQIYSAFHRKFPCGMPHRKIPCIPDSFSLEIILYGEVLLFLDDNCIHLKGPCVFWIGDHHRTFQFELIPGETYEHIWIDFSGERGRRIYESLSASYPQSYIPLKSDKNIIPLFEQFVKKYRVARHPSSAPQDVVLMEQLLLELTTQKEEVTEETDPYGLPHLVEKIKKTPFIRHDPRCIAASCDISYVYFRKKFKEYTGETFHQFLLKQQMLTAGELLKNGQFRIKELADYCNFPDLPSFTRTFKRFYKLSPREYLHQYGKK